MLYPPKTSPRAIFDAAWEGFERDGAEGPAVRGVAAALGLAPNALFRYHLVGDALLAAVADEGAGLLLASREDAGRAVP
ncbi:MAG: hypothetical protein AVDCRST_MAG19-3772 [uncultured Thermomicrobiales bacterium]|uniref:HTH tetR-type domain-containing protein n=1 Tax=uncultured Thermomicrobiales bacterium TaxID=1645740 RepID=A0A6J4VKE1_9BACT|nr:MAG: hypothetical protein AVDCRST_MAG19-3772 [uncultured Thermomicrobiales bacterium]